MGILTAHVNRPYVLAIGSLLAIPAVTIVAGRLINSINPEIAAGYANYERNFRLLTLAKSLSMLVVLLVIIGLWFLTCFFLITSKRRSYGWLPLGVLGPFGLIILTMLSADEPARADSYQRFVGRLPTYVRVFCELIFFVVVWVAAYRMMVLKRNLMIMYESFTTGVSTAEIINQQTASSGMWAFSEGLEVLLLLSLLYLLRPICFNVLGLLPTLWTSSSKP